MDGLKAIGGLAAAAVIFFGLNFLFNRAPEPIQTVMNSPIPLVAAADEVVDGVSSDVEDRFVADARRTEMFRLVPATRAEIVEMGYWLCRTTREQRATAYSVDDPSLTTNDIAYMEVLAQPLLDAALESGLCFQ